MTPKEYSIRLEKLFHKLCPACGLSSDDFLNHPDEALENGLSHLMAVGLISSGDMRQLLCGYSFNGQPLREYLKYAGFEDVLDDLIGYLKSILKTQEDS